MRSFLFSTLIALTLFVTPSYSATSAESPGGLLKGKIPDKAASIKRVVVSNFVVQFVVSQGVESKKTNDTYYSLWKELSPEAMQNAANVLYSQLSADLKEAGIEVVAHADLEAHPAYADLSKVGKKSPAEISDKTLRKSSILVSAHGLPIITSTIPDAKLSKYATAPAEGTNVKLLNVDQQNSAWLSSANAEVFSLTTVYGSQSKFAESLNATVLNVRMVVPLTDIGIQQKVGGFGVGLFGGGEYGIVTPNPRIVEAGTVFGFIKDGQNLQMVLQKPVPLAGIKVNVAHNGDGKVSGNGGGLIGFLAGGANDTTGSALVKVDGAELQKSLATAGSTIFKELARTLTAPQ